MLLQINEKIIPFLSHPSITGQSKTSLNQSSFLLFNCLCHYWLDSSKNLSNEIATFHISTQQPPGGTIYNVLYGDAPPEKGTFFRL